MKFETEIKQWGNSLAVRISGAMAQEPMFAKGSSVVVETSPDGMTIKLKTRPKKFSMPFKENELLSGIDSRFAHAELLTAATDKEFAVE